MSRANWLRELVPALDVLALVVVACWREGVSELYTHEHAQRELRAALFELGCDELELAQCAQWLDDRIAAERVRQALEAADATSTESPDAQVDVTAPACASRQGVQAAPFELSTPVAARRTPRGGTKALRASVRRAHDDRRSR